MTAQNGPRAPRRSGAWLYLLAFADVEPQQGLSSPRSSLRYPFIIESRLNLTSCRSQRFGPVQRVTINSNGSRW